MYGSVILFHAHVAISFVFVLFLIANMSRSALTLSDMVKLIDLKETEKLSENVLKTWYCTLKCRFTLYEIYLNS